MTKLHPITPLASKVARTPLLIAAWAALSLQPSLPAMASLDPATASDTAVSGYPGAARDAFFVSIGDRGITEISWEELNDSPCMILINGKDPDNAPDIDTTGNSDNCGGNSRIDSRKTVRFKDNPRYFVRGISVCTNDKSNHRVKGLKIVAAKLPAGSGSVDALSVTDKAERRNCKHWHATVKCPGNKVASGLNVKVLDQSFVGIGLKCKAWN